MRKNMNDLNVSTTIALASAVLLSGSVLAGDPGAAGDCYIMMGDNTIQQYDGVTGDSVGAFATDMINNVRDLTFGPNGNLYVLNNGSGTVEEYDGNTGALLGTRVTDIVVGESMVFLDDGTMLVSHLTPSTIEQYDTEANGYTPLGIWATGIEPLQNSMILGADGRVYAGDRLDNTVKVYDQDGSNMAIFADGSGGELNAPEGISFGGDSGNLFVASFSANSVTEWDGTTGAFVGTVNTDEGCPDGLRFAPNGQLWVSYVCNSFTSVMGTDGVVNITITDGQSAPRSMTFKPGAAEDCLTLEVSTLVAGEGAAWEVSGAEPNGQVAVVYGFEPGTSNLNEYWGVWCANFGIANVKGKRALCVKYADGDGNARCTANVPASKAGLRLLSQAAMRGTCPDSCVSNLDDQVIG